MNEQDYLNHKNADQGRRDALRRIALLPLQALGLGIVGTTLSWASEDILTHCAAGITACEHLANGLHEDMTLAFATLSAYLPTLKAIVQDLLLHRKQAARLTGQAFFLKSLLSLHFEGPQQAALYAEQGINYSKESGSLPLQLILLRRIAWIYACDRQNEKAVEKMLEAQYLLEHASDPLPAFVQSYIYSGVADNQGRHGQMDEALLALRRAHETFSASSSNDLSLNSMMPYDLAHLLLADGLTHYHLGQYDEALASFAQVIDLETLTPKIPVPAERVRFEIINYQALASLKRPEKDMELSTKLWNAGLQGAKALHSEQHLNEALSAYDIMQALWPTEKRISDLRERLRRW